MTFEFATTPEIHFGHGVFSHLGEQVARFGKRAWLVTGSSSLERMGILDRLEHQLAQHGVTSVRQQVHSEPDTTVVDHGANLAREAGCDLVVGIGGGSALDAGKAIACLLANQGECLDYLEVVGRGKPIERESVPFIAVPTTGGTGSEVTHNAVIAHSESKTKASIRSRLILAKVALVDPKLSYSAPPSVTASTGLDALTQLIEPYVSKRAHPMTDPLALEGIRRAVRALPRAYARADDVEGRSDMMLASLLSGIALAHAGLGAAHALAGPLGGAYPIPHGIACAALLPHVMEANLRAAARDRSKLETVNRYAEVALALGAQPGPLGAETALRGVGVVQRLCRQMQVPPLAKYGVTRQAFSELILRARRTSSMKANPVELSDEEMTRILRDAGV